MEMGLGFSTWATPEIRRKPGNVELMYTLIQAHADLHKINRSTAKTTGNPEII